MGLILVILVATTLGVVGCGYWLLARWCLYSVQKTKAIARHDGEPARRVPLRLVYDDRNHDASDIGWHRGHS
jgi:uncharacterized membrane protein